MCVCVPVLISEISLYCVFDIVSLDRCVSACVNVSRVPVFGHCVTVAMCACSVVCFCVMQSLWLICLSCGLWIHDVHR